MLIPGKVVFNAREFAASWFEAQKRQTSIKKIATDPYAFGSFFLDYDEQYHQYYFQNPDLKKAKGLTKDALGYAFAEVLGQESKESMQRHGESFKCTKENLVPLKTWIKAVTGSERDTDLNVMAQWMWSVKRKALGLPVRYHIMPVLYGPQGAGKTEALKALFGPMVEFRLNLPMNEIGDPRQFESMSNNLIVFYDELSGIQRTDLNALKNQITTDYNSYRKLNTHITATVPMACSFIAASNKRLDEQFTDSTGARRFYELESVQKLDWVTINGLDYTAMWLGIDEQNAVGYLTGDVLVQVTTVQQGLVTAEDVEMYLDDRHYSGEGQKTISASDAYRDYQIWCANSGVRNVLSLGWFVKKLKNRGIESKVYRDANRARQRDFIVSDHCQVAVSRVSQQSAPLVWKANA